MSGMGKVPEGYLDTWRALLAAHSGLVGAVEDALARAGLPPLAWYDVLLPLQRAKRPLRMGELSAEVVTIGRTGLTRVVDRLVAEGLIERSPCATDRRGVDVAITTAGVAVLRRMWPVYARVVNERFVAALDETQVRGLHDALTAILAVDGIAGPTPVDAGERFAGSVRRV